MNDCLIIKKLIQLELDSIITNEEQELITQHLADCDGCEKYRTQMFELENKLESMATSGPHINLAEPDLIAGIIPDIKRIAEERRKKAQESIITKRHEKSIGWWGRFVRSDWAKRYGIAVALIVMMVPVGIGISYNLDREVNQFAMFDGYGEGQEERSNIADGALELGKEGIITEGSKYRVQPSANELVVYSSDLEVFRTDSWIDGVRADYEILEGDIMIYRLFSVEGDKLASYKVNLLTQEVEELPINEAEKE